MRPTGPTFWRIGGRIGWQQRTASADNLAVSDAHGLRLDAAEGGMLSLRSIDGSLGGLALPRGMAFDREMTLYLLGPQGAWVKRWDAETRSFAKLPEVGGEGDEPRRLRNAESLAIANDWLYIADAGNHRVQIFDLRTLVLIDLLFIPQWLPVDLAAHKGAVYILDKAMARVFRHTQDGRMARVLERPDRAGKWPRVITDQQGRLYLLNDSDPDNVVLEQGDPGAPPIPDPGFVRDLFDQPAIRMDERKRFFFPESVARVCRHAPAAPPDCRPRPQAPSIVQTARGRWLTYVARRAERRVDAYVSGARLRHCWGAGMDWQPADVAACGDTAFILDERNQIVYRHHGGSEDLKALDLGDTSSRHWSRVACDRGTLYLYMPGAAMVQVFSCAGAPQGERCYADLAALFEAQRPPEPAPAAGGYFDSTGQPVQVDLSDANASPLYRASGSWQSKPLDSQIYRCQWHRIELSLSEFPPGSRVSIATCATETADDVYDPAKARFIDAATLVAPLHQPQCPGPVSLDCLVQSGLGQFLAVRMTLEGDGFSTPAVDFAKIHYPRDSYLQYLPATYSTDDESRVFLERFLSIFQTEWDELEDTIGASERYFDPDAVPEGPFMDYLAQQWLAVPLEGDWSGEQKRRLLSAIPKIYPHRGQLGGLRDFVSVYLANIAGLETAEVRSMDFPVIVEGFREREYLFASAPDTSTLGPGAAPLWSASVKRRLQLGVYSTEGEAELVSVGDPEHDVFNLYAHRFHIYVPAAWVRSASAESMLRRALNAEKPTHTQYDLHLVDARFRVEAQSSVGLDTIIGEAPVFGLACPVCATVAPSLPPSSRLGHSTVLAGTRPDPNAIAESGYSAGEIRRMQ